MQEDNAKLKEYLSHHIRPHLSKIQAGFYPRDSLQKMADFGIYAHIAKDGYRGLLQSIMAISEVSSVCANTGFCVWCQNVLLWYLMQSNNESLRKELVESLSLGNILGGTGLSNPIKSYANLEKLFLKAREVRDGFVINGSLPWVSNIDYGHIFAVVCDLENRPYNIAGIIRCGKDNERIALKDNISFIALGGSATKSIILKDYFMPYSDVLGLPAEGFLLSITAGFLLLQVGIAMGCLDLSIKLIDKSNIKKQHINTYLPISRDYLFAKQKEVYGDLLYLTNNFEIGNRDYLREVLQYRINLAHLVLESTQSAMLHAGASAYIDNSLEHKLLLESYFVALVSPSLKHLYKELDEIKKGRGVSLIWSQIVSKV